MTTNLPTRNLGGPGSGNWGHAGRPGKIGGSAPGGGLATIGAGKGSSVDERRSASQSYRLIPKDQKPIDVQHVLRTTNYSDAERRASFTAMMTDRDRGFYELRSDLKAAGVNRLNDLMGNGEGQSVVDSQKHYQDQRGTYRDQFCVIAREQSTRPGDLQETEGMKNALRKYGGAKPAARQAYDDIYQQTQDFFASKGIGPNDELVIYRGLAKDGGKDRATLRAAKPGDKIALETRPLMSFSLDRGPAESISNWYGGTHAVVAMRVKRKDIWSHFVTGFGCASEAEVLVKGDAILNAGLTVIRTW